MGNRGVHQHHSVSEPAEFYEEASEQPLAALEVFAGVAKLAKGKAVPLELRIVTRSGRSIQAPIRYRVESFSEESEAKSEAKTSAARQRPPTRKAAQRLALVEPDSEFSECESDFDPESESEAENRVR